MYGVGKHIYRLDGGDGILFRKCLQIAGLGGGVATYVHNAAGCCLEEHLANIFVHACAGRIGDDYIGVAMLCEERIVEQIFHVACVKIGVGDVVDLRVDFSIGNGCLHIFEANYFFGAACHKVSDGAGAGI